MKKIFTLCFLMALVCVKGWGQTISSTTYPLSTGTSSLVTYTSLGTLVVSGSDDGSSALTNIGFDFWYDGVRYTQFAANANGWLKLGTAVNGGTGATVYTNNLAQTNVDDPKIAPYWDDLTTGSNGFVKYGLNGTAPNRTLVVEWKANVRTGSTSTSATAPLDFEAILYESTGQIQFIYGGTIAANSAGYSVGFNNSATDMVSVATTNNTATYGTDPNTTQPTAIAATKSYTFTPLVPIAPTGISFSNIAATSYTINWTDNASNEIGYVLYYSTDNINFTYYTQIAANSTSANITGLSANTPYYWKVYAVTEGALSSVLSGSQTTASQKNWVGAGAGGAGTDFNAAANWSPAVAPTAGDNLVMNITSVTSGYVVAPASGSTTVNFNTLTITYSATLTAAANWSLTIPSGYTLASTGNVAVTNSVSSNGALKIGTLNLTVNSGGTFTVGNNLSVTNSGSRADVTTINNSGSMTVTGTTVANSANTTSNGYVQFLVGTGSTTTFTGAVTFDGGSSTNYVVIGGVSSTSTGKYTFRGNVNLGPYAAANNLSTTTFLFDANGSQTITDNLYYEYANGSDYFNPGTFQIGSTYNPIVTLVAGSSNYGISNGDGYSYQIEPYSNITINGSSALILSANESLDFYTTGGTLALNGTSTLKLLGLNDFSTLGSNIPSYGPPTYSFATGSTVEYGALGSQTVYATPAYGNLTIGDATPVATTATAVGALTIAGNVLINSGATFAGSTYSHTIKGNWTNSGAFTPSTGKITFAGTSSETLTGATTFNNLTFNNAAGFTLASSQTVGTAGTLTLTKGIVTTTATNILTVTNAAAAAISGGSGTAYVNGPVKRSLAAASAYTFPVGKGGGYYPFGLTPSSATASTVTAEAFNANSNGTAGTGLCSISNTEYWQATLNSGSYTGTVSLTRPTAPGNLNAVGINTTTATGAYSSLGGTVNTTTITSTSPTSSLGYFVMAIKDPALTTISYSGTPFCYSASAGAVTLSGTAGGTFSSTTGLTINASTGTITPSTSTPGTYTVTYDIAAAGTCPAYTATTSVTITPQTTISYAGTPFCYNASTGAVTLTGTTGGTFSSTTGLTINAVNGTITPSSSTASTYTVTYNVPASGGCAAYTATTSITITPLTTISYTGTPFCYNASTGTVTLTGTTGGTFSSTTGLTINATTGNITPSTSTTGSYTVTYNVPASGGCAAYTATTSVTITPQTTISYAGTPFCYNDATAEPVTFSGTTGGTFSSTTGLTINATTGTITPSSSTAGTYTVKYVVPASGGCATYNVTTSVTVTPQTTISYAGTPFCYNASAGAVTLTGTTGGTFSSTTGLTINATTGNITPSTSTTGTYTVTYNVPASGGCATYNVTTSVTVTPQTTISYTGTPFCYNASTGTVTLTGTTGGTFSSTTGLTINSTTGAITPSTSTAGTYTVTYNVPVSGGCAAYTATTSVTITPQTTISYSGTPYCSSVSSATVTLTGTTGGTFSSTTGLTINATTGAITPSTSTAGTYTVTYNVPASGGCAAYTATTSVTITAQPSATISYAGTPFCSSASPGAVTISGTTGGIFSSTTGLTINATTGTITPSTSTAGNYTVKYVIAASGGCAAYTATTSITITAQPSATISYAGTPFCSSASPGAVTISGTTGGTFSSTTGLTINAVSGTITPSSSTAGTYTVSYLVTASGGCAAYTATTSVTITAQPSATISYASAPFCSSESPGAVTFSGTTGGTYSATPTGLSINTTTGTITPSTSTAGTYIVRYIVAASGGCAAYTATTSVKVTAQPSATISYTGTPFCPGDSPGAVTFSGTTGGTYSATPTGLTIEGGSGTITPSTSTAGTYTVRYVVAASGGCAAYTATTSVTINPGLTVSVAPSSASLCTGGSVSLTASGATTYSWSPTTGLSSSTGATVTASPTVSIAYTVIGTTSGCSGTDTVTVQVTSQPIATAATSATPVCSGTPVTLTGTFSSVTTTGTIGLGTTQNTDSTYPAPFGNFRRGVRTQMLIRASELTAAGLTAGNLTSVSFDVVTPVTTSLLNFEVNIGTVPNSDVSGGFISPPSGFVQVYSPGAYAPPPTAGYTANTITFTTPFLWDGTSNILLQTCFNNLASSTNTSNAIFNQTVTSYKSTVLRAANANNVCGNGVNYTEIDNQRPNVRFGETPTTSPVVFSTYAWKDGSTVISGSNSNPYTVTPTNATANSITKSYTVTASNTYGCSVTSSAASVVVNPITIITSSPVSPATPYCQNTATVTPLSVSATGSGTLTYQWYSTTSNTANNDNDGVVISQANSSTYTPPVTAAGTFYYYVRVTGDCGHANSGVATVIVNTATAITSQPSTSGQDICLNSITTDTLSVSAIGTGTLTYQWYRNPNNNTTIGTGQGQPISGATSSSYIVPTSVLSSYYYFVVVTSNCGQAASNTSGKIVVGSTQITGPANATYCQNDVVTNATALQVTANGIGISAYQWYQTNSPTNNVSGTVIINAETPRYKPPTSAFGTFYYYVVVTSQCGDNASSVATVTVNPATAITGQPSTTPQSVCQNSPATQLSVTAVGTGITYQWYSNATGSNSGGTLISGATASTYTPSTATPGTLYYYVAVTGGCAPTLVTSNVSGAVTVNQATVITSQPQGATYCQNDPVTNLSVTATGSSPLTYQWYVSTTGNTGTYSPINGAASSTYTPSAVIGTRYYYVTITSGSSTCGTVTSSVATITINPSPAATVAANSPYACSGTGGSFTITGTPNSTVFYNIDGGSTASKTLDASGSATVPVGFITGSTTLTLTSVSAGGTGCTSIPTGAGSSTTITAAPLPLAEDVTGGGNYCQGDAGVPVGLSSSQSGVSYQLLVDDGTTTSPVGSPVTGTGSALSFGNQTIVGTYSVQATNTTTGCVKTGGGQTVMVGYYTPATITTDAAPTSQTVCQNGTPTDLTVTAVGNNLMYQWYSNTTSSTTGGTAIDNTNSSSYTPVTTATGTLYYYVTVTGPCRTVTSSAVSVTISALPVASFTSPSYSACGSSVAIGVSGTNGAVVYYSYTGTANGSGSVTLTGGSATTDGTGTINSPSSPGTYNYTITSITNGCTGSSSSITTATINAAPTISLSAGSGARSQTVCSSKPINDITFDVANPAATPTVTGLPPSFTSGYMNGVVTISGSSSVPGTYNYTVTVPGGSCGNVSDGGTIVIAAYLWTGGTDSKWNTATNWCSNSIPADGSDVTIDPAAPYFPVLPSGPGGTGATTTVGNLVISTGNTSGTLTIGTFNTLQVNGAITGDGAITGSSSSNLATGGTGTVNFTQTGSGNVLQNLAVTGGTLTLGNALNITAGNAAGVVTVSGTGQLATGGNLTLKSDAFGTASIGQGAAAGNYITGAVVSERYTDAGKGTPGRRAWRLVTSPVSQAIYDAWQEGGSTTITGFGTQITGEGFVDANAAAAKGYDYIGGGNHTSIKQFDATGAGAWVPLDANTDTRTTGVRAKQAYMLFVRGDRTVGSAQPTAHSYTDLRAKGSLVQGDQPVSLTPNSTLTLVGNPYASTIDFSKIYNSNTTISNQFYLWNSQYGSYGAYVLIAPGTTGYVATPQSFTNGVSSAGNTYQYIPSGSGFFVFPNNAGTNPGSLTIHEADKASGSAPPVNPFRVVAATNVRQLIVNLNQKSSDTSATLADGFRAKFSDDYAGNEEDNSSRKAWNFNENLNLVRNGNYHIIEARADVQKTDTLFMQMWNVTKRSYQLQMKADNFTPAPGVQAWLVDNYLSTKQELSLSGSITTVDFAVNSDSLSSKTSRFMIVFRNSSAVLPVTLTSVKAAAQNGGVNVSWTVTNEANIKSYTIEKSTDGSATFTAIGSQAAKNNSGAAVTTYGSFDATPKVGDNYYRIRIEAKDGAVSYSQVMKVTIGDQGGTIQIAVYPNPVRNGRVSLQLTNLAAGTYLVSLYSSGGQTVYQKKITISQPNTTQSEELRIGSSLAQGSYQLRLTDNKGSVLKETSLIVGR